MSLVVQMWQDLFTHISNGKFLIMCGLHMVAIAEAKRVETRRTKYIREEIGSGEMVKIHAQDILLGMNEIAKRSEAAGKT